MVNGYQVESGKQILPPPISWKTITKASEQFSHNIIGVGNQIKIEIWTSQFPIHTFYALYELGSMGYICEREKNHNCRTKMITGVVPKTTTFVAP